MMSRNQKAVVAYQGEPGAYSEAAVFKIFGSAAIPIPCKRFSEVFDVVQREETEYGVVPIENSIEGSVSQVYDLFLHYDLKVIGESPLRITHCLIANPETDLKDVRVVYSHPQALGQCRTYLEELNVDLVSTYDTAGSVKMIKEQSMKEAASVAGEQAAEIYNMKILAKDIADTQNNFTRFFVLSKEGVPATGNDKTSIIFSTKHVPGALHKALGVFASRGINMTKIESRPTKEELWEYNFYLDFEGHVTDPICVDALKTLKKTSLFVKILGSYPRGVE